MESISNIFYSGIHHDLLADAAAAERIPPPKVAESQTLTTDETRGSSDMRSVFCAVRAHRRSRARQNSRVDMCPSVKVNGQKARVHLFRVLLHVGGRTQALFIRAAAGLNGSLRATRNTHLESEVDGSGVGKLWEERKRCLGLGGLSPL